MRKTDDKAGAFSRPFFEPLMYSNSSAEILVFEVSRNLATFEEYSQTVLISVHQ